MAAELGLASVAEQRGWEALRAVEWTLQRLQPRHVRVATPGRLNLFGKSNYVLTQR